MVVFGLGRGSAGQEGGFAVGTYAEKVASRAPRGIFFRRRTSKMEIPVDTLIRHGDDVLLVWDAERVESDVVLRAGLSLAKALCVRQQKDRDDVEGNREDIDAAILAVEKEAVRLASMKTWTETIQSNSGKILDEVRKMTDNLAKQVAVLRESVETLKQE
jgi:hypothetical protein